MNTWEKLKYESPSETSSYRLIDEAFDLFFAKENHKLSLIEEKN